MFRLLQLQDRIKQLHCQRTLLRFPVAVQMLTVILLLTCWTKISGPTAGTITNPNSATTTVTGMVQGVYSFELRVTDNNGAFGRDTMQVDR